MPYGQFIIGPPGSGKTTYCNGMQDFLNHNCNRKTIVINLDPANDRHLPYKAAIDICDLICLDKVMIELGLGPNGALVYCMKYLENNIKWLEEKLIEYAGYYLLFDLPGQVELYTHEISLFNIVHYIQKSLDLRLTVVHMVDAQHCTDSGKFISVVLLSLSAMIRMELPHINILSKIDLIEIYGNLAFNLEFYTDVLDLRYLLTTLNETDTLFTQDEDDEFNNKTNNKKNRNKNRNTIYGEKYRRMNELFIEIIEDFSLVSFHPLNIQDGDNVQKIIQFIDKSNGYIFQTFSSSSNEAQNNTKSIMDAAITDMELQFDKTMIYQEKYIQDIPIDIHLEQSLKTK